MPGGMFRHTRWKRIRKVCLLHTDFMGPLVVLRSTAQMDHDGISGSCLIAHHLQ
jgi:hypothetical protein